MNWSLSVFWNRTPPAQNEWLDALRTATNHDGMHLLEHRFTERNASQFLISTRPETAPPDFVRSIKGRLQYLVREKFPKAFRRNYSLWSVGSANAKVVEQYIADQTRHHRMADRRVQERIESMAIDGDGNALTNPRASGHAQFCYNLHVVLVSRDRGVDTRTSVLERRRAMLLAAAPKKGHVVGKGRILADHLHLALGCQLAESPQEVAISYLNNLVYTDGMKPTFQYGFYVGTFSRYDLEAIRQNLR